MSVGDLGFRLQRVREQLKRARKDRATDLQCKSDQRTQVVIDKQPRFIEKLSRDEVQSIHDTWLSDEQRAIVESGRTATTIVFEPDLGRIRLTACIDDNGPCADFRIQPAEPPRLEQLDGLTKEIRELHKRRSGIVLVTAPPTNAKTYFCHAMISTINHTEARHIATCEDPAEFIHEPVRSAISPHTLGKTVVDEIEFAMGIRRRNVTVAYIGELLDVRAMRAATRAAANGLVLATFHAKQAPGAIEGFIEMFPSNERDQIRVMLAENLAAVVGLRLIPLKNEPGMVLATELLLNDGGLVKKHILDGDYSGLVNAMMLGQQSGMHLLEQSLAKLVVAKKVRPADAEAEVTRSANYKEAVITEERAA